MVLDEQLRAKASEIAQKLRKAGRRVDLVLEGKKMKWVFKVCVCLPTGRLIMLHAAEFRHTNLRG